MSARVDRAVAIVGLSDAGSAAGRGRSHVAVDGRRVTCGSLKALLELEQLAHEVQIGRNDGTPLLDHRVRLDQSERRVTHQVGDGDGRRSRNSRVAMDQHGPVRFARLICKKSRKIL